MDSVFKKASFPFQFNANKEEEDLKKFHEFVSNLNPDDFLNQ